MPGSHGTLCINSFYPETELNITEILSLFLVILLHTCRFLSYRTLYRTSGLMALPSGTYDPKWHLL